MDFELDADQKDVLAAVEVLLERHAGVDRARAAHAAGGYDEELLKALVGAGFADFAGAGAGPLEAVLTAERIAVAAGCVPYAARALVAPALLEPPYPDAIALLGGSAEAPVRFAAEAEAFLAPRGDGVVLLAADEVEVTPVESPFRFPFGLVAGAETGGRVLAGVGAESLAAWSRVALAAEMVGCMEGAMQLTVAYLSDRHQFGRPLGSFQALQHRLAELHVQIEGARWLTRQAAWQGAPPEAAAAAATASAEAAAATVAETHQLTGAMGLTEEYDLHLWTMRLAALRLELGGAASHAAAAGASLP